MSKTAKIKITILLGEDIDFVLETIEGAREQARDNPAEEFDHTILRKINDRESTRFLFPLISRNKNTCPLESILRSVRERYLAFALDEHPYFDQEFWNSHSHFYGLSFKEYDRYCHRIHFFSGAETRVTDFTEPEIKVLRKALLDGSTAEEIKGMGFFYKGFTTLRPTATFVVGRSAIAFDRRGGKELEHVQTDLPEKYGVPCCNSCSITVVNLCCASFKVDTPPFIQQDPVVGACATASIWVASQVLAERFGLHKFPYDTITRQATERGIRGEFEDTGSNVYYLGGLFPSEICKSIERTGAVPYLRYGLGTHQMQEAIYPFVEAGLPVILCYSSPYSKQGHAVTAVGHLLNSIIEDRYNANEALFGAQTVLGNHHLVSHAVSQYYAHNDAYGPFDRYHFLTDAELVEIRDRSLPNLRCPIYVGRNKEQGPFNVDAAIVPMPPYVRNTHKGVLLHSIKTMQASVGQDAVVWRLVLADSAVFKRTLSKRHFPPELRATYSHTHLPKYSWLVEFTLTTQSQVAEILSQKEREVTGEFLYDTTTPENEIRLLTMRIGKEFTDMRIQSQEVCQGDSSGATCYIAERFEGLCI